MRAAGSPFEAKYTRLADKALATGEIAVGRDVIAVPDLLLAEFAANGHDVPPTLKLRRVDGREVAFFQRPPGAWPPRGAA